MTCKPIRLGGITAIVCSRGRAPRPAPCSVPNCGKPHTRLCDFPLVGRKAGRTCSRKLCESCSHPQPGGLDFCPAHDVLAREKASLVKAGTIMGELGLEEPEPEQVSLDLGGGSDAG